MHFQHASGGREIAAAAVAAVLCAGAGAWALAGPPDVPSAAATRTFLRLRLAGVPASAPIACFYARRGYAPAWSAGDALTPQAGELLAALAAAEGDGLRPDDYRAGELARRAAALRAPGEPAALADLDLALTGASLGLAHDLAHGKVSPREVYSDCALPEQAIDLAGALERALAGGSVGPTFAALAPVHRQYVALRQALARYRHAAPQAEPGLLPAGRALRTGDRSDRVAALRARLTAAAAVELPDGTGGASAGLPTDPELLDAALAADVARFQARHGLAADGVVGVATRAELERTAADRIRTLAVNLERWRWLAHDLGRRHILVNVAAFELAAVEDGQAVLASRIIVGRPYRRTPVFSSALSAVVLNPPWWVPEQIAREEVLPKGRRDPAYLAREGFDLLPDGRVRQRPGSRNALGPIKLTFPNRFDVYLHGTPAQALFGSRVRTFSHGCIRVEKPFELALWALRGDPRWTAETVAARLATGREATLPVRQPIPIHVTYWTAWVGEDGGLRFTPDVYGRDEPVARRLEAPAPAAAASQPTL